MSMFRQRAERVQQARGRKIVYRILESCTIMRNQRRGRPRDQVIEEQTKLVVRREIEMRHILRSSAALLDEMDPVILFGCLSGSTSASRSRTLQRGRENLEDTRGRFGSGRRQIHAGFCAGSFRHGGHLGAVVQIELERWEDGTSESPEIGSTGTLRGGRFGRGGRRR